MEISGNQPAPGWQLSTTALEGSRESLERLSKAAERIGAGDISVANMIALKEETLLYSMNLKLIKIADEMIGQTLNILV